LLHTQTREAHRPVSFLRLQIAPLIRR
jgi:hypothetical protein